MDKPWSSLVEGGQGSYLQNSPTNSVFAFYTLSVLFIKFISTTAYYEGRYEPSSPVSCRAPRININLERSDGFWVIVVVSVRTLYSYSPSLNSDEVKVFSLLL